MWSARVFWSVCDLEQLIVVMETQRSQVPFFVEFLGSSMTRDVDDVVNCLHSDFVQHAVVRFFMHWDALHLAVQSSLCH